MKNKIYKQLLFCYYIAFTLFFAVFFICLNVVKSYSFDFPKNLIIALQSVGIMYVMASIPFALWYFHRIVLKIKTIDDNVKVRKYKNAALIRIFLIAFGVLLNVMLYCVLHDKSMFYCAVIAALAFIFCKPQKAKIEQDLFSNIENEEEK